MDMKEEVEIRMEKLNKKPLAMQYRDFVCLDEYNKLMKEESRLTDIAKGTFRPGQKYFELVIKFDVNNAIVKDASKKSSFADALYTVVHEGKSTSTYYASVDEALLGYLELKNELRSNSGFVEFISKMLK
jgi:hypothetical protein